MHNQLARVTLKPLSRKRWTDPKTTHLVRQATNKPGWKKPNWLPKAEDLKVDRVKEMWCRFLGVTDLITMKPLPFTQIKMDPQQHQEFFLEPDPTHRKVDKDWIMTNMFPNPSTQLKKP